MTNKAYEAYLRNALDHYMCNTDDDDAIHRFIDWLGEYEPEPNGNPENRLVPEATPEPDAYAYAEGNGFAVIGLLSETELRAHDIDPAKIPADILPGLINQWAEETNDTINGGDLIDYALERALAAYRDDLPADLAPDPETGD